MRADLKRRLAEAERWSRPDDIPTGMAGWYALPVEQRDAPYYPEDSDDAD